MISSSDRGMFHVERSAVEIGYQIHMAVIDEGRREGVFAYLYEAADGRAWFEKYDRRTGVVSRRFSKGLMDRIRLHGKELRAYVAWHGRLWAAPGVGSGGGRKKAKAIPRRSAKSTD